MHFKILQDPMHCAMAPVPSILISPLELSIKGRILGEGICKPQNRPTLFIIQSHSTMHFWPRKTLPKEQIWNIKKLPKSFCQTISDPGPLFQFNPMPPFYEVRLCHQTPRIPPTLSFFFSFCFSSSHGHSISCSLFKSNYPMRVSTESFLPF